MNNLNIWVIQKNVADIGEALNNIKKESSDVFLFNGCTSKLEIENKEVPIQFETLLYSMTSNTLIIIMRDSQLSYLDLKNMLQEKQIQFREYQFETNRDYQYNEKLKEFLLIGNEHILKDKLVQSTEMGQDFCKYYPNSCGKLEMFFNDEGETSLLKRIEINGAIDVDDKIILLTGHNEKKDIKEERVYATLLKAPIKTLVCANDKLNIFNLEKDKKKLK